MRREKVIGTCTIEITDGQLPLADQCRPAAGERYAAKKVSSPYGIKYRINVRGENVSILPQECKEVSPG